MMPVHLVLVSTAMRIASYRLHRFGINAEEVIQCKRRPVAFSEMEVRPPQLHVLCVGAAVLWNVILEKAAPAVLEPFASPNSRRRGNVQARKLERK